MKLKNCTIVTPTRNRPEILRQTAETLCKQGLGDTPMIVVDDFSEDQDATERALDVLENGRVIRQPERRGQAAARNVGMRAATTDYVLLVDDDCYLVDPEPLVQFVESIEDHRDERTAVWRFPTIRESDGDRMGIPAHYPRGRMERFAGNGALMDRERILSLGGFRDFFVYRLEEDDLSIRIFRAGWRITYVPDVEYIHRWIPNEERSEEFNREYRHLSVRNTFLYYALNYPLPLGPVEGAARALKSLLRFALESHRSYLGGLIDGIRTSVLRWRERTPLSWGQWWAWKKLRDRVESDLERARKERAG